LHTHEKTKIAVIGGGPAGIMAAYAASLNTNTSIDLYERNEKLGKKLYITGKGRCNVTNSGGPQDFFDAVTGNKKFFYSAFYTFDNFALMNLIEGHGTKLVSERGNRVFPESGKSSDILKALGRLIDCGNIRVLLHTKVDSVKASGGKFILNSGGTQYDKVILAGGGKSYPSTGSDGNMYAIAREFGHKITPPRSGLCGIETADSDTRVLSGLSLKNVVLIAGKAGKKLFSEMGEMEFTHYGISGPLVLSLSSLIDENTVREYAVSIDLKPGLNEEKLDARILRDISGAPNKEIKNVLGRLLPQRLMETIFTRSGVDTSKKCNQMTKEDRRFIIDNVKNFAVSPLALRPIEEAIITKGGVDCGEINPSTMESKIAAGLYFAGEMIDLDALTGGFNLQIAFSTGYLSGMNAAEGVPD
jgi:predicted Rossmann fold flavoprotein